MGANGGSVTGVRARVCVRLCECARDKSDERDESERARPKPLNASEAFAVQQSKCGGVFTSA